MNPLIEAYYNTKRIYEDMVKDLEAGVAVHPEVQELKEDCYMDIEEQVIKEAMMIMGRESEGGQALHKLIGTEKHDRAMELAIQIIKRKSQYE